MKRKAVLLVITIITFMWLTACGNKTYTNDDTDNVNVPVPTVTLADTNGKTLNEILGRVTSTPIPKPTTAPTAELTVEPTTESTNEPTTEPTEGTISEGPTPEASHLKTAAIIEDLSELITNNKAETKTDTDRMVHNAMNIFTNNVRNSNYIKVETAKHSLSENTSDCTVVSSTDNGSIVSFKSNTDNTINSLLVVYITDLTAWTVIGENDTVYALMPTPKSNSTEYEKQIVQTIIDQNSNGKDLKVELIYPYTSAFDGTNNCAVYLLEIDGTFNIGSNAKLYAFYKYDYVK